MQVSVEDLSPTRKMLHVELPEDVVAGELDNAYNQLKKNAKIKGFRPGKAPRNVLERLFKKDVHNDLRSKLVKDSIGEAVKDSNLVILGPPIINPPEFDEKGPFKYEAIVEVKPEVDDIDYKGLELKKNNYKPTDDDVEKQLKRHQKDLAKHEPICEDRPVADGDLVVIDYEGFKDGKPHADVPKTEDFKLKVGEGYISNDFDACLIGLKRGDTKNIKVLLPRKDFSGDAVEEIEFHVTIKEILKEILPDIDDEFAKKVGRFNSLDELKSEIYKNVSEGYAKRAEHELNEQIFKALLAKTEFEVPEVLVEYELQGILNEVGMAFSQSAMTQEQMQKIRDTFAAKYRDTAIQQVRRHVILGKIIEQENLTLSDEDIEQGFVDVAKMSRISLENVRKFYDEDKEKFEVFKNTLLEKKAIKLILDNSSIEEVDVGENVEKKSEKEE